MKRKRLFKIAVLLAAFGLLPLHVGQVWPVRADQVAGVYQSSGDPTDIIHLMSDGIDVEIMF